MPSGLGEFVQQDFSVGMVRSVAPHLIPENGFYDGVNLLLNTDGSPYKRGGTTYKSNAAFGTGLRFLWDGFLAGGQRTVFASPSALGVLGADDTTPASVGGSGLSSPVRPTVLFGLMYLPGGQVYGGSRRSSPYSTGTVAVTNLGKTVTGTGTTWSTNLDAGMVVQVGGAGSLYGISSVDSNTQITLSSPYQGATASGVAYAASAVGSNPGRVASIYGTAGNRLATGEGARVYFSAIGNPGSFAATDYHELPGGANVIALEGLQNTLLVFTTQGLWTVSNFAFDLTDAAGNVQQSLQKLNGDLICWGNEGIAAYHNALIVPTVDGGVWLVDTVSAPTPIGGTINTLLQSYVQAGNKPGLATVHNNHYFLPILDSGNNLVDFLVCRLDRPSASRLGTVFPWTRWAGTGASVTAVANRISASTRQPVLLGALGGTAARVIQYQPLVPDSSVTTDADASVPAWKLITRDYPTNGLVKAFSKKTRVRYELIAPSGGAPTIQLAAGTDARPTSGAWGAFNWGSGLWTDSGELGLTTVTGDAPVDIGSSPYVWPLNLRARYVRLRLSGSTAATRMILRTIEVFTRAPGRQ